MICTLIKIQPPRNCWVCMNADSKLNIALSMAGAECPLTQRIDMSHDIYAGRHPECPMIAIELMGRTEGIVPINLIGGILKEVNEK